MKHLIPHILITLALTGGVAVIFMQSDKYLKHKAIDDCMKASTFTYTDTEKGTTTMEPMKEPYEKCLQAKGY